MTLSSSHHRTLLLLATALLIFFCFSCKKADFVPVKNNTNKVLAYLELQKEQISSVNKIANIDLLKENLDFSKISNEELDNNLNILIVPIKDEVISKKNLNPNSTLTLFLFTDKQGEISSAGIVYFFPANEKKHISLPQNTISNMLSGKSVQLDGVYKMLTITGRWLSKFEIKNGKLFSTGTIEKKDKDNNRTNTTCIDWYEVTTLYMDGMIISQTSEYIGTTCYGCDNPEYQMLCPEGEGGAGGGSNPGSELIESREETFQTAESETSPLPDLSGNLDLEGLGQNPSTIWKANVTYAVMTPGGVILSMTGHQPYPVPPSQPFIDANGNAAMLYNDCGPWTFTSTPLTPKSWYAHWSFLGYYRYYFTTGVLTLPRNKYIGGIVSSP